MKEIKHHYRGFTIKKRTAYSYTKEFVSYSIVDAPLDMYDHVCEKLRECKWLIDRYLDHGDRKQVPVRYQGVVIGGRR